MTNDLQSAPVSSDNPLCIVILVDQSTSMAGQQAGTGEKKSVVVTNVVNDFLQQLVQASTTARGSFPYKNYFDVAVFGYGPGGGVTVLLNQEDGSPNQLGLFSIAEIASRYTPVERNGRKRQQRFTARSTGPTVMRGAFERAATAIDAWIVKHGGRGEAFAPVVLNVTDGGFADTEDPTPVVRAIQEKRLVNNRSPVVFNFHIYEREGKTVKWSTIEDAKSFKDRRMQQLFNISSPLPEWMLIAAQRNGYRGVKVGSHGYVFNGDAHSLIEFFNVGTQIG
jgi:hypothetical protein